MKKIILIFIMIGIYSLCQAKPWYDYDVYTSPADGDHFLINDISETGPPDNNEAGTLKRLAWLYVQPRDSDLTAIAALTTATYGRALLAVATELAFQQLVNLEIGVDVQAYHINLVAIADAETGVVNPGITMYDDNGTSTGTAFIYGTTVDGDYDVVMSIGVEEDGSNISYIKPDGINEVTKFSRPIGAAVRMVDIDTSSGDYTVTSSLGTNLEDWNGVWLMTTHTSGNYDVVIPDCATPLNINGVSSDINKYDPQITVCQKNASETVQVVSASAADYFVIRDGTNLADGYEINSSGAAQRHMCVFLTCAPIASTDGAWVIINETGGEPCTSVDSGTHACTDGIDPSWVTGGAAD